MKRSRLIAVAAGLAVAVVSSVALAAGLWSTLPLIGGAAYCTGTVTGTGSLGGTTGQGQGTIGSICGLNEPAGPATFAGTEMVPMDLLTPGSQSQGPQTSAIVNITQLGQGPMLDVTSVASAQIPNQTPFYFLDSTQASAFTISTPSAPVEGQIQHIVCTSSTAGTLTVSAAVGQNLKNNPNTTCSAGTGYQWRYQASNQTWYRF